MFTICEQYTMGCFNTTDETINTDLQMITTRVRSEHVFSNAKTIKKIKMSRQKFQISLFSVCATSNFIFYFGKKLFSQIDLHRVRLCLFNKPTLTCQT